MTVAPAVPDAAPTPTGISRLWRRELDHYPATRARYGLLALIVLSSIVMYYQQYVAGSVSFKILGYFQMSFRFYLLVVVASSVAGAVSSLVASVADRIGRANMVVVGLLVVGLVTLFGIPNAHTKATYALAVATVGFFEGMVLVATPALVRDFSPSGDGGRPWASGPWGPYWAVWPSPWWRPRRSTRILPGSSSSGWPAPSGWSSSPSPCCSCGNWPRPSATS